MNSDKNGQELFELLTRFAWDSGIGRKMLFLKGRYYVFDNDNTLLDGGAIRYNPTLEKIFIRNEDLRGEVFLSQVNKETLHLQGTVLSKLAGKISIDNLLRKSDTELFPPLSRVAKVEKHLSTNDIYKILMKYKDVDNYFLRSFEKNLHAFSNDQAYGLYTKLAPFYFQNFEMRFLKTVSLYFSLSPINDKLYEELFMFIMVLQSTYEKGQVQDYDINFFITVVKKRLLEVFEHRPSSIPINMINETLLYFKLDSPNLPSTSKCIDKLYDKDLNTQQEYAYYLSLMGAKAKEVEEDIFRRLVEFYQEKFFTFKKKLNGEVPKEEKIKKVVTELSTQLALIQALENCKSDNKEIHLFLLFLLSNNEELVQNAAKKALINIKDKALITFKQMELTEAVKNLTNDC